MARRRPWKVAACADLREVCITRSLSKGSEQPTSCPLWSIWLRKGVREDPTLCGLLNGDVGHLCGVTELREEILVLCVLLFIQFRLHICSITIARVRNPISLYYTC